MDAAAIVYNAVDSDRRAKGQAMTTTRRRRTKEEARDEILSAAAKRLLDDGPDALRIADVAADGGMSHPPLLHHVGSRGGLARGGQCRYSRDAAHSAVTRSGWTG